MFSYVKELYSYRELLYNITLREIKVRYKQTMLGAAWAILQPLSMMLLFTLVFSKFIKLPTDGIPHPVFYYCGLLPWTFFSTSVSFAISSLVNNRDIISKVYFPREIFPIANVIAALLDFVIASSLFIAMLIFYRINLTPNLIYLLPVILIQIIFTLGICLFTSAINVYYRDVRYAMPLFIQLLMFASPVIYPVSMVSDKFKVFYMLNPMAVIIEGYRSLIVKGAPPDFYYLSICGLISLVIFLISYSYFRHTEMKFADVI